MNSSETAIRYLTTIHGVREVTLAGTADARYWTAQLGRQGLVPLTVGGKAQLALGATALRWLGLPFRELTLSVAVGADPRYGSDDGQLLIAAFNSSRPLAALERSLFHTPYRHAVLRVDTAEPVCFELGDARSPRLAARMGRRGTAPALSETWWQGPIYLPRAGGKASFFRARLGGPQHVYAWDASTDSLTLPRTADPLARLLEVCGFEPREWRIRTAATHARTQTLQRTMNAEC